jgi:hypothetical protein
MDALLWWRRWQKLDLLSLGAELRGTLAARHKKM